MSSEREGILFCLVGPAGGGKTTVGNYLLREFASNLQVSVSVTSRKPRDGEIDGKSYHFISRQDFEERVRDGHFFEWEEVHKNLYGTLKKNLDVVASHSHDLLLVIDIKGALNIKKHYPNNSIICFLTPPSLDVLKMRLKDRGNLSEADYKTRLQTAEHEFAMLREFSNGSSQIDYLVVNDDLQETCETVKAVLVAERQRLARFRSDYVLSIVA